MNRLERGIRNAGSAPPHIRNDTPMNIVSAASPGIAAASYSGGDVRSAMKLSAVNRCIEILSDSMGKLPVYIMDRQTRERIDHPLNYLLTVRPNEAQTPTVMKKMIEANRICKGNGYAWIVRDPTTLKPKELLPIPAELCVPFLDQNGSVWYTVTLPASGEVLTVHRMDMLHVMGFTHNGWKGIGVLERAAEVVEAGRAAQLYNLNYYENGGQPAGILQTDSDLAGYTEITLPDGSREKVNKKDFIRNEWEKRHSGPTNAQRVAILDLGLKYTPISLSNRDAQFVEQAALSVEDIARFFGVPLYKLQAGKQSYSSNEQNAIEYVVGTLHPTCTAYEEEYLWKLLTSSDAEKYRVRVNMMAELRGDFASRATWYGKMREIGAYSVNDIRALEDMPDVPGGDARCASLNFVPLELWPELSVNRNGGNQNENND